MKPSRAQRLFVLHLLALFGGIVCLAVSVMMLAPPGVMFSGVLFLGAAVAAFRAGKSVLMPAAVRAQLEASEGDEERQAKIETANARMMGTLLAFTAVSLLALGAVFAAGP